VAHAPGLEFVAPAKFSPGSARRTAEICDRARARVRGFTGSRVVSATIGGGPPHRVWYSSPGRPVLAQETAQLRVDDPADGDAGGPLRRQLEPNCLGDHVGRLYRAAYGLCGSREDAEDLVQDTLERVMRRPRFIRHDQDLAYLLRVLRNTWISSGRVRRLAASPYDLEEVAPEYIDEDPVVARVVDGGAVYDALRALTDPLREAVVAVDVVGLSYRDAARALGVKEGTIMSRLHRGRSQIAAAIEAD